MMATQKKGLNSQNPLQIGEQNFQVLPLRRGA